MHQIRNNSGHISSNKFNGVHEGFWTISWEWGRLAGTSGPRVQTVSNWTQCTSSCPGNQNGKPASRVLRASFFAHEREMRPILGRSLKIETVCSRPWILSNHKYRTFIECDCFRRPRIFYLSASYRAIAQFLIGQSAMGHLDKPITSKTAFKWMSHKLQYNHDHRNDD